ncbi:VOC family protein [Thaumasiovibrio subtropicus]|uniref:VOC family protein n=1 Tax=Thaumasiovibrio subtropicus TaxID=1891207 RepID=UPI000B3574DB|nr:VOC family protein [Thaumasiovibrio subtropicus]
MMRLEATILYVEKIDVSSQFYASLFYQPAQVLSPTFHSFSLGPVSVELKQREAVKPEAILTGGGMELSFEVADQAALLSLYDRWIALDVPMAQEPEKLVFGWTFVAEDPDKHRIRVFAPSPAS